MPVDEADRLLIAQVRQGDQRAWQDLIDRFEGRLQAFVQSRLDDPAATEDVVQETFLGFLTSLPNYDASTPLESFLFAIAAHKLTDLLRREGRRPTIPFVARTASGRGQEPAGRARTASSILRSREGHRQDDRIVAEALGQLIDRWLDHSEFERLKCIELLFVLGWPNKIVARELGITEQAVANHKHFVITQLKAGARRVQLTDEDLEAFGVRSE